MSLAMGTIFRALRPGAGEESAPLSATGLEAENEAEAGLEGPGMLLDGEIVLSEVRGFEEGLADLGADAEVGREVFFQPDGVVVGHAGLGLETLAAAWCGTEGGGAGTAGDEGFRSEDRMRRVSDIADGVL